MVTAWIPIALLAVPLAAAALAFVGRGRARKPVWVAASALALGLAAIQAGQVASVGPIEALRGGKTAPQLRLGQTRMRKSCPTSSWRAW